MTSASTTSRRCRVSSTALSGMAAMVTLAVHRVAHGQRAVARAGALLPVDGEGRADRHLAGSAGLAVTVPLTANGLATSTRPLASRFSP